MPEKKVTPKKASAKKTQPETKGKEEPKSLVGSKRTKQTSEK